MERHCANALALAEWLQKHPKVEWVSYAGLPGDRYHALAQRYLGGKGGAVFTFGLKGGYDAGVRLVSAVKLFSHVANMGDTSALIIHPSSTKIGRAPWRERVCQYVESPVVAGSSKRKKNRNSTSR